MVIRVTVIGMEQLTGYLARGGPAAVQALSSALRTASLESFAASQRQVPVDKGTLRASGVIEPPKVAGTSVSVEFGYGGAASAYALYQHEGLGLSHPGGGKAKFLEDPVRQVVPRIAKLIEAELKRRAP